MTRVREFGQWPKGRVERISHQSEVLEDNPWNDPVERELCVYLPHNYSESGAPLIALWDLAAFTNSGPGHLNWRNQGENLPQRLDRLIGEEKMPPVVVPMPDCYTSLGGNQYVNSTSVGRYSDYLNQELVPLLSKRFNVRDDRNCRAMFGKSSGGYGALYLSMKYPDVWGAAASHAGDAGFEWIFLPEFPKACRTLNLSGGDIGKFLNKFWSAKQPGGPDYATMMVLAMAASYDPRPSEPYGIRLPFDLHTMELDQEAWQQWLRYDPVSMIENSAHQDALRSLHGLYIDVGCRDQYNIQYGNRRLYKRLEELSIDCHYEEFDGTHSGIDWRLDYSLPWLVGALVSGRGGDAAPTNLL
ncbi:MAG TPA: alpha/beta hydrolase-fold protein [Xanthomonadales bacterium]|nr:alpha/beta hydrolase-fold protein [Xanthomonadales bacterium]